MWQATYKAWGEVESYATEEIEQNLRFQGQYFDAETGLHYNTFRYYDPVVGRFGSQDLIGLIGSENLYSYAPSPITWVDPFGLSPSQQLAAAMAKAGNPVPSGYAAHHLIPTNVANRSNLIQEAINRGIYNPNGATNGTALPMTAAESLATGKPLHSGGHLGSYYDAARTRLLTAEQKIGNLAAASDKQILSKIGADVSDEDGQMVWQATYKAWGEVESYATEEIEQNLRFQGQYFDAETGLHYNTFRYYDPVVGRFVGQDPIGLAGGTNIYLYGQNPVQWIDPLGWCSTKLGNNMGARPGDGMANHHLIPEELMKHADYAPMFNRLKSMGFDGDGASNGIFLPGSSDLAKKPGFQGTGQTTQTILDQ